VKMMTMSKSISTCCVSHGPADVTVSELPHCRTVLMDDTPVVDLPGAGLVHDGTGNVAVAEITRSEALLSVLAHGCEWRHWSKGIGR